MKYHPDKQKSESDKKIANRLFQSFFDVFQTMSDEGTRRKYDEIFLLKHQERQRKQDEEERKRKKQQRHAVVTKQGMNNIDAHCYIIVALQIIMGMKGFMKCVIQAQECVAATSKSNDVDIFYFIAKSSYILNHFLYFIC